jgi:hypothetical protein
MERERQAEEIGRSRFECREGSDVYPAPSADTPLVVPISVGTGAGTSSSSSSSPLFLREGISVFRPG